MKRTTLRAAAALLAALALPASAKTYYVDAATGDDANIGLSQTAAFKTIQRAIDKAATGSTILVAPGVYAGFASNNKSLSIKANPSGDGECILVPGTHTAMDGYWDDGKGQWVDVEYEEAVPVVADLGAWGNQAAVGTCYWLASKRRWSPPDNICLDPGAPWGTGAYFGSAGSFDRSDAVWDRTKIVSVSWAKAPVWKGGNRTRLVGFRIRGGVYGVGGGTLEHCSIEGVSAIAAWKSSLTDSSVSGCTSEYYGSDGKILDTHGGVTVFGGRLNRCRITDNAIAACLLDSVTACNCLIAGNYGRYGSVHPDAAGNETRDIDCEGSLLGGWSGSQLFNCTIANNCFGKVENESYDERHLGALFSEYGDRAFNCILWNNRDANGEVANVDPEGFERAFCPNQLVNSLADIVIDTSRNSSIRNKSTGNIAGDPLFIDPANGDYRLAPNSPCVNAGADYTKTTGKFDLDSGARKVGKVDMGAYELQPQTAVPADYDGDGFTDAAFYFAASGQWWIFQSRDGLRTISLSDRNGVPCPAAYDGGAAEPAYFTAAAKEPEFVRVKADGTVERTAFGAKGATPVAAKLDGTKATFGVYTANAKKPEFSFLDDPLTVTFGAKASRPVVADFDADGKDDIGVYTATASKPAFSILQSSKGFSTASLFQGGPVALGAKGAIPCCADFDKDGAADFATYMSNTKAPYFTRLPSSRKFRETWTLPMGSKGDAPVVGVYEDGQPAAPAVWTGTKWTYVKSDYTDVDQLGE